MHSFIYFKLSGEGKLNPSQMNLRNDSSFKFYQIIEREENKVSNEIPIFKFKIANLYLLLKPKLFYEN
jgi:hypothetical protein